MRNAVLSAQEIAEHQLLAALKLWQQSDYLSALTLAGAAEEILGKRLKKIGIASSFEKIKNDIVTMAKAHGDTHPKTEKLIGDLLNQTRNELKHYDGEESLSFDLREDAAEMLGRAISNYQILTGIALEEAIIFWEQISAPNETTDQENRRQTTVIDRFQ